ncbi:MAG: ribonuclease J [Symbiobacteriaceae bacterium]|nr:ribonuclease J [Symbiobacteriaceae bacterium]
MNRRASRIQVIPLGGVGEIGKSMTALRYGREIIVIDAGLKFPDDEMLGIDLVLAKIDYLKQNRHMIQALILTHAHEDHIGGVPYLLRELPLPVYASPLTHGMLAIKLKEHHITADQHIVTDGIAIPIGKHFKVEFLLNNHSIPDSYSLAITTPAGIILHSGDFKFDQTPVEGDPMDLQRLASIGNRGVLALICDSTNAEREGFTRSDRVVGQSFDRIFRSHPQSRIIIASFASNIHRIQQVFDTVVRHKRSLAAVGRSMVNNIEIASALGYLRYPAGCFLPIEELLRRPVQEQVILSTGSQGEPLSGLSRMANQNHPTVNILPDDLVILSSSPISGNDTMVNRVVNGLYRAGATVIHQGIDDVHVSGHANSEDLKLLYNLVKPRYILPFHGEFRHQAALIRSMESMGVPRDDCYRAEIGDVIEISADSIRKVGKVDAGATYVDGLGVGDVANTVLRERQILSLEGTVTLVLSYNTRRRIFHDDIEVLSRGFVYMRESEALIEEMKQKALEVIAQCRQSGRNTIEQVKNQLDDNLSSYLFDKTGRRPMIIPVIVEY